MDVTMHRRYATRRFGCDTPGADRTGQVTAGQKSSVKLDNVADGQKRAWASLRVPELAVPVEGVAHKLTNAPSPIDGLRMELRAKIRTSLARNAIQDPHAVLVRVASGRGVWSTKL